MAAGRHEEGVDLLRNALAASSLRENEDDTIMELSVLSDALLQTRAIDEVETLLPRYREAAKAESRKLGRVTQWESQVLLVSARLLEVGQSRGSVGSH